MLRMNRKWMCHTKATYDINENMMCLLRASHDALACPGRVIMPTLLLEFYPSICLLTMHHHIHPIMLSLNNLVYTNNYDN